jgi:RNA-binding protein PNO1
MVAPTAKKEDQQEVAKEPSVMVENDEELIDVSGSVNDDTSKIAQTDAAVEKDGDIVMDQDGRPKFNSVAQSGARVKKETRNISVPPHRYSPLRAHWNKIYAPLVGHLKLQVKMETKGKKVMIRTCKETSDPGAIQKGEDFLKAFMLGFDIDDAVALLRLDDLYVETFEVKDVKTLNGDHLARAIGRIAGKDGKTKFAIENASRTRVVLADSKIHILGGFANIKIARETIVSLILGAPPGKVYGNLRIISSRMKERF